MKLDIRNRLIQWLGGEVPQDKKLRYSKAQEGRCNVYYGSDYICRCDEKQKEAVQTYFDAHYDGDIKAISDSMKEQFNTRVKRNTDKPAKIKRGRKLTPYYENNLRFAPAKTDGRIRVQVTHMGKTEQLCTCYDYQKPEVIVRYNGLVHSHSFDEIKTIMKREYNLR